MHDEHLYKSPAIEVCGHCRLLLPWLRCQVDLFSQYRVEILLSWAAGDWTHNLSQVAVASQPQQVLTLKVIGLYWNEYLIGNHCEKSTETLEEVKIRKF